MESIFLFLLKKEAKDMGKLILRIGHGLQIRAIGVTGTEVISGIYNNIIDKILENKKR